MAPSFPDVRSDEMTQFVSELFREARFYSCVGFKKTKIPVVGKPDPAIKDGGKICSSAETHKGIFSVSSPIALSGFSVWKIFSLDRIGVKSNGHVGVGNRWLSVDITKAILSSALGQLFPKGKIQSVPLKDLFKPLSPSSTDRQMMNALLGAAKLFAIQTKVCPENDETCAIPKASLALYLDIPQVLKTYADGGFQKFDFRGVFKDSFIQWSQFPLASLPLPKGIKVQGTADIEARYLSESGITQISISNIQAEMVFPSLLGIDTVKIEGKAHIELHAGGRIKINLEKVSVRSLQNPSFAFNINLHLDYDPENFLTPFWTEWRIRGRTSFTIEDQTIELESLSSRGEGGWTLDHDKILPRLDDFNAALSSGLSVSRGEQKSFSADRIELRLEGRGRREDFSGITDEADLTLVSRNSQYAQVLINPSFALRLKMHRIPKEDQILLEGAGETNVRVDSHRVDLKSSLSFLTDFKKSSWILDILKDQLLGPLRTTGHVRVEGDVNEDKTYIFNVSTKKPIGIFYQGKKMASGVRVVGKGDGERNQFRIHIPWIRPHRVGEAELQKISGSLHVSQSSKSEAYVSGNIRGEFDRVVSGPFSLAYRGLSRWDWKRPSLSFSFLSQRGSSLVIGPLSYLGMENFVKGEGNLTGMVEVYPTMTGLELVGRRVGIQKGQVIVGTDQLGMGSVTLQNLSLLADHLRGFKGEIARSGGEGFRLESDIRWRTAESDVQKHLSAPWDVSFLSKEAFWKLFHGVVQQLTPIERK